MFPCFLFFLSSPLHLIRTCVRACRAFSVFKWGKGGSSIEGVDEDTVGLLDEHKLSIPALGERYCTSLNPDRPEQSRGMDQERAAQVKEVKDASVDCCHPRIQPLLMFSKKCFVFVQVCIRALSTAVCVTFPPLATLGLVCRKYMGPLAFVKQDAK